MNDICPWYCIFNSTNHKNLAKAFLYFDILTWSQTWNLESWSLTYLPKSIYLISLTSISFILIVLWYVLLYLLTISSNLLIYKFFDAEVMYFYISVFKVLINLLAITDFPSLFVECISISFFSSHGFTDLL